MPRSVVASMQSSVGVGAATEGGGESSTPDDDGILEDEAKSDSEGDADAASAKADAKEGSEDEAKSVALQPWPWCSTQILLREFVNLYGAGAKATAVVDFCPAIGTGGLACAKEGVLYSAISLSDTHSCVLSESMTLLAALEVARGSKDSLGVGFRLLGRAASLGGTHGEEPTSAAKTEPTSAKGPRSQRTATRAAKTEVPTPKKTTSSAESDGADTDSDSSSN